MDRKKRIKLLSLNLGIAAANIITFSPVLIGLELAGAGALETASWQHNHLLKRRRVNLRQL